MPMNDPLLAQLGSAVARLTADPRFVATLARVAAALEASPREPQAWAALPPELLTPDFPSEIRSCWVFMLRGGATFGAERHPNSHQRSVALRGTATFEVLEDNVWAPRPIAGGGNDPLGNRWISIPPNTWHRIQIGPDTFVSCSFHTAEAAALIEETPVAQDLSVTHQRLYQSH